MRAVRLACAALALLAVGCAPTPVEVDLSFPSRDTFLFSEFGRLLVYEANLDDPTTDCPALLSNVNANRFGAPVHDSDWLPICDFRAGGVSFGDVPPGPHAYVVLARDAENRVLLTGCRVSEAFEGAAAVDVRMFPTGNYEAATSGRTLRCGNEDDKCRVGC